MTEGRNHCLFSPESVVQTIQKLVTSKGLRDIEFVDNVFNAPYDHALAICRGVGPLDPKPRLQTRRIKPALRGRCPALGHGGRRGSSGWGSRPRSAVGSGPGRAWKRISPPNTSTGPPSASAAISTVHLDLHVRRARRNAGHRRRRPWPSPKEQIRPNDVAFFNMGIRIYPGTGLENIAQERKGR